VREENSIAVDDYPVGGDSYVHEDTILTERDFMPGTRKARLMMRRAFSSCGA
jgi:hypothetical protein